MLLALQLAPDGTVSAASVLQSDLRSVRGSLNGIAGLVAQLEETAVETAKRATFHVNIAPGTTPTTAQLRGLFRVAYRVPALATAKDLPRPTGVVQDEDHAGTTWVTLVRTPYRPPSWSSKAALDGLDIADFDGADWYPIQAIDLHPSNDLVDIRL